MQSPFSPIRVLIMKSKVANDGGKTLANARNKADDNDEDFKYRTIVLNRHLGNVYNLVPREKSDATLTLVDLQYYYAFCKIALSHRIASIPSHLVEYFAMIPPLEEATLLLAELIIEFFKKEVANAKLAIIAAKSEAEEANAALAAVISAAQKAHTSQKK
jgi:hypothetical protein